MGEVLDVVDNKKLRITLSLDPTLFSVFCISLDLVINNCND